MLTRWRAAVDGSEERPRGAVMGLYAALLLLFAGYALTVSLREDGRTLPALDEGLVSVIQITAAVACLGSASRAGDGGPFRLALGSALLLWSLGDLVWSFISTGGAAPVPSAADPLFLAFYPLAYVAVILMARGHAHGVLLTAWLDGLMCALATAAVCGTLLVDPVLESAGGDHLEVAVNLAYPIGDTILLAIAVGALVMRPGRRDVRWLLLVAGGVAFVASDIAYLLGSAAGTYRVGTVIDLGWPAGFLIMSMSAWLAPPAPREEVQQLPPRLADNALFSLIMPGVAAVMGTGVLAYGNIERISPWSLTLACAALVVVAARVLVAHHDLRAYSESRRLSYTDDLTGLGNRRLFHQCVDATIREIKASESSSADEHQLAVLLMDLNGFKEINESFGHGTGDELLRLVAVRLRGSLRRADLLTRFDSDEFAIMLRGSDTEHAMEVAQRLTAELRRRFTVADASIEVKASIGIARYPKDARHTAGLLRCADVAMYRAKHSGFPFTVYDQARDDSRDRFELVGDLRQAIDERQLTVYYQPQLDLRTGEIVSVEALVRWPHPVRGMIPPDTFIPIAEDTGLIRAITAFVLDSALAQCARWRATGSTMAVAVNVSANDVLDHELMAYVERLLERHGLPSSAVTLEITERVLMADIAHASEAIRRLQDRGITLSIDDFGTGFSSLAYLRDLAVGELKLDRTFVTALSEDGTRRDTEIVRSIVGLAHALRLRVVAEGIEDERTLLSLRELNCDLGQGYFIGRPAPAADAPSWCPPRLPAVVPGTSLA